MAASKVARADVDDAAEKLAAAVKRHKEYVAHKVAIAKGLASTPRSGDGADHKHAAADSEEDEHESETGRWTLAARLELVRLNRIALRAHHLFACCSLHAAHRSRRWLRAWLRGRRPRARRTSSRKRRAGTRPPSPRSAPWPRASRTCRAAEPPPPRLTRRRRRKPALVSNQGHRRTQANCTACTWREGAKDV